MRCVNLKQERKYMFSPGATCMLPEELYAKKYRYLIIV